MLFLMREQKQQGGFSGDKIYSQQFRFTKEKQSVHSGTVGFGSCVPMVMLFRQQYFSVPMLCLHWVTEQ